MLGIGITIAHNKTGTVRQDPMALHGVAGFFKNGRPLKLRPVCWMQREEKKAKSRGGTREHEGLGLVRNERVGPGRIDEYNFFLSANEDADEEEEGVQAGVKTKKRKKNGPENSMAFFLSK